MILKWSTGVLISLLATSAFAQEFGKWQTNADSSTLSSTLVLDRRHAIVVKNENNIVSFIVESPQYLKSKMEDDDIKAMMRFDSSVPDDFRLKNVERRMAVISKDKARDIIQQMAAAKKIDLRIYTHSDDYCDDLQFDTMVFDVPANTPAVVARVLRGP